MKKPADGSENITVGLTVLPAVSGANQRQECVAAVRLSTGDRLLWGAQQTSGKSMNIAARVWAIRLK